MKCIETIDFGPYLWSTSPSFKLSYNRWDIQVGFCFSVRKFSFSDYRIYGAVYPLPEYLNKWSRYSLGMTELDPHEIEIFRLIDGHPGAVFHLRWLCMDHTYKRDGYALLMDTVNRAKNVQRQCCDLSECYYKNLPELLKSVQNPYGSLGWQVLDSLVSEPNWEHRQT